MVGLSHSPPGKQWLGLATALLVAAFLTVGCTTRRESTQNGITQQDTVQSPTNDSSQGTDQPGQGPVIDSLQIFASSYSMAIGGTSHFFAVATYSDSSTEVVSNSVNWSVANPSMATISPGGLLSAVTAGITSVSASLGGLDSNSIAITIEQQSVQELLLAASSTQLHVGSSAQLTVLAVYSSGSSVVSTNQVNWQSSDPNIVEIVSGTQTTAMAMAPGTVQITATLDGVTSQSLALTVLDIGSGGWIDTAAESSLDEDDSLFTVFVESGNLIMGTTSSDSEIHTHYVEPGTSNWNDYEFTGRMKTTPTGAMGVTFFSDYPNSDSYYRLRISPLNHDFRLSPHPFLAFNLPGQTHTGVIAQDNTWYRFRIHVADEGDNTSIKARVWEDGSSEPQTWHLDLHHAEANRLTGGTVGFWSTGGGSKYFDDFAINGVPLPLSQPMALQLSATDTQLEVGDTTQFTVTAISEDGSTNNVTPSATLQASSPVLSIQQGVGTAAAPGTGTVTATYQGFSSNPLSVSVNGVIQPPPTGQSGPASAVSQYGITWTFDGTYQVGQYVTGDYWVVGPVHIVSISPPSIATTGGRVINGSMVNPALSIVQGYDSAMYDNYDGGYYNPQLNVAHGVSASHPLVLQPNTSLCSSISNSEAGARPQLYTIAVLTVVASPPPDGSFRPPYVGSDKTSYFNVSQASLAPFANLDPGPAHPNPADWASKFKRPWIDHCPGWLAQYFIPTANLPSYGRDISRYFGVVALLLNSNISAAQKMPLLINVLQGGIDLYGVCQQPGSNAMWPANGGHDSGRKLPILMAGRVFNHAGMLGISGTNVVFGEDDHTFYVGSPYGLYTQAWINSQSQFATPQGIPEWGAQHGFYPAYDTPVWYFTPGTPIPSIKYRRCCTGNSWAGTMMTALIMGLRDEWDHEAFFDYEDRYMQIELQNPTESWYRQLDSWTEWMYDTYRSNYP